MAITVFTGGCAFASGAPGRAPVAAGAAPDPGVEVRLPAGNAASTAAAVATCGPDRVRALVGAFVAAYNARDLAALRSLFDVEHRFFEYFDSITGAATHATHVQGAHHLDLWERHLGERFALDERLAVLGMDHYAGYANVRLARSWEVGEASRRTFSAGAKVVCDAGGLTRVVMTTGTA